MNIPDGFGLVQAAAAFSARAHRHQTRKDGETPYVSHVVRVCLTLRHVFGVADESVMAAALLHDTVEDTATDFDDIVERFGPEVASWVAALTKDTRLPDAEREEQYAATLAASCWQVQVCKLADIYDNLHDLPNMPPGRRPKSLARSRFYLEKMKSALKPETAMAFAAVEALAVRLR